MILIENAVVDRIDEFADQIKAVNKRIDKSNNRIKQLKNETRQLRENVDDLFVKTIKCNMSKKEGRWVGFVNKEQLPKTYLFRFTCRRAIKKYVKTLRSNKSFKYNNLGEIIEENFYL